MDFKNVSFSMPIDDVFELNVLLMVFSLQDILKWEQLNQVGR